MPLIKKQNVNKQHGLKVLAFYPQKMGAREVAPIVLYASVGVLG